MRQRFGTVPRHGIGHVNVWVPPALTLLQSVVNAIVPAARWCGFRPR